MEFLVESKILTIPSRGAEHFTVFSESGELADADSLVTTATIDGYFGSSGTDAESEFSPTTGIAERSILPNSRFYLPDEARSEQDLICSYIDDHPYGGIEHQPLHNNPIPCKISG